MDAAHGPEQLVAVPVFLRIMAPAVDLDDEVEGRDKEVGDSGKRFHETLLEAIVETERSEAPAELVFGRRRVLPEPGDENCVPF